MSTCHLCCTLLNRALRVIVTTDGRDEKYVFHATCFEKCTKGFADERHIKPSCLAIYDGGRVVSVVRDASIHSMCCLPDCDCDSDVFIPLMCTNSLCTIGQAHAACIERQEKKMMATLRLQRNNTMKERDLLKAMYKSKFDIVRPLCKCACTAGHFYRAGDALQDILEPVGGVRHKAAPREPSRTTQPNTTPRTETVVRSKRRTPRVQRSVEAREQRPEDTVSGDRAEPPADLAGCPPADSRICPISRVVMRHPVSCVDGHFYELSALEKWFERFGKRSPISGLPLSNKSEPYV